MAETSTLLSLPQLVDLSLNCQEGLVHFHALHALLRIVIQQASLEDVTVEFRGKDGERVRGIIASTKPSPGTHFTEYSVNGGAGGNGKNKKKAKKTHSLQDVKEQHKMDKNEKLEKIETAKEKELRVIERRKDSKEDPEINPAPLKSPPPSVFEDMTMVLVDSKQGLPQLSVAVTKDIFDSLQNDVDNIKVQVKELKDLPGNMGLIGATRDNNKPIVDMLQIMSMIKRVEAAEKGMEKLGSLMEDLVKLMKNPNADAGDIIEKMKDMTNEFPDDGSTGSKKCSADLKDIERRLTALEKYVANLTGDNIRPSKKDDEGEEGNKEQEEKDDDSERPEKQDEESEKEDKKSGLKEFDSLIIDVNLSELPIEEALDLIQKELKRIVQWTTENLKKLERQRKTGGGGGDGGGGGCDVTEIDAKFEEYTKQLQEIENVYNNQITLINQSMGNLQKELDNVTNKIEVIVPGGDSTGVNAETMMELANKLLLLEKEIISVSEHASGLQAEKVELDKQIDVIMEQLDILKIVKANREDLEDALGDKADACAINRKVSHDQFDAACDDLSRGIEEALAKLQEQEDMWKHALDNIYKDVGNKLDKSEVDPLRDFVNSKLKALQERFKALAQLKKEQEAAGTKSKLLRDVNCISCDKDVVMRKEMDISLKPKPYAMPPPKNIAPYLAYELDQLRKQQKCIPGSKNLNFLESALKQKRDKEHVCNRYCGGSHTVTTPQQRVARLGHFLEQWGPDLAPAQDEYIRGKDGQMYKASTEPAVPKLSKAEPQERTSKSASISKDEKSQSQTYINQSAEQLLTQDKTSKTDQLDDSKKHSIGAAKKASQDRSLRMSSNKSFQGSMSVDVEVRSVGATFRPGKEAEEAEPRGSDARSQEPRASDARSQEPRGSEARSQEPRASDARSQEPRGSEARSQEPRASEARSQEPRGSEARSQEPRGSQARSQEPRASEARSQEPRGSEARPQEPRGSQARSQEPRGSEARSQEPRGSEARSGEPRGSEARSQQEPRGSEGKVQEPRGSEVKSPRASEGKALEPRGSEAAAQEQPRGSDAKRTDSRASNAKPSDSKGSNLRQSESKGSTAKQSDSKVSTASKSNEPKRIGFEE